MPEKKNNKIQPTPLVIKQRIEKTRPKLPGFLLTIIILIGCVLLVYTQAAFYEKRHNKLKEDLMFYKANYDHEENAKMYLAKKLNQCRSQAGLMLIIN